MVSILCTNVVVALANQYLVQWRVAQRYKNHTLSLNSLEGDGAVVWVKPQTETIKISVDGATFEEYQSSGIQAIRSKVPVVSPFGCIVGKCRSLVKNLNNTELLFVKRSANMTAHALTKESCSFPDRWFDKDSVPSPVKYVVMVDAS